MPDIAMTCGRPSNTIQQHEGAQAGQPSISGPNTSPVLSVDEWRLILYEATPVSRPLIVRAGAAAGAWELPRNQQECPCCGTPKGEA